MRLARRPWLLGAAAVMLAASAACSDPATGPRSGVADPFVVASLNVAATPSAYVSLPSGAIPSGVDARIRVVGEDTGGDYGRSVFFDVGEGSVLVRSLRRGDVTL